MLAAVTLISMNRIGLISFDEHIGTPDGYLYDSHSRSAKLIQSIVDGLILSPSSASWMQRRVKRQVSKVAWTEVISWISLYRNPRPRQRKT